MCFNVCSLQYMSLQGCKILKCVYACHTARQAHALPVVITQVPFFAARYRLRDGTLLDSSGGPNKRRKHGHRRTPSPLCDVSYKWTTTPAPQEVSADVDLSAFCGEMCCASEYNAIVRFVCRRSVQFEYL